MATEPMRDKKLLVRALSSVISRKGYGCRKASLAGSFLRQAGTTNLLHLGRKDLKSKVRRCQHPAAFYNMFIIFGTRSILKNLGIVFKNMCNNCHNEKYWVLTRTTRWFTLFFIPIFPTSSRYSLSCPVCKYGIKLNQEQIEKYKPIAEANTLLANGAITQEEYQERLNLPKTVQSDVSVPESVAAPSLVSAAVSTQAAVRAQTLAAYCKECGTRSDGGKFCGQCGNLMTA